MNRTQGHTRSATGNRRSSRSMAVPLRMHQLHPDYHLQSLPCHRQLWGVTVMVVVESGGKKLVVVVI